MNTLEKLAKKAEKGNYLPEGILAGGLSGAAVAALMRGVGRGQSKKLLQKVLPKQPKNFKEYRAQIKSFRDANKGKALKDTVKKMERAARLGRTKPIDGAVIGGALGGLSGSLKKKD